MISNLEHATEFLLQGWALHEKDPSITVFVDININGAFIARIPAHTFRSDLLAAGYGSGHHAFFFNPLDYLSRRENLVEVRESPSSTLIANGAYRVKTELATDREAYRQARLRSQSDWPIPPAVSKGANTESAFLGHLLLAAHFHPGLRILEVGTGAGHLLNALLKRKKPFSSYLGLDLSRAHVDALGAKFANNRTRFLTGDAARFPLSGQFDLIFASSVFSHLFPCFLPVLKNTCASLTFGGLVAFDLAIQDDRVSIARAEWQNDRWQRIYSQMEIRRLLNEAGLEPLQMQTFAKSETEHRVFVAAMKIFPRNKTRFEML